MGSINGAPFGFIVAGLYVVLVLELEGKGFGKRKIGA
jgi:hypothetical protein